VARGRGHGCDLPGRIDDHTPCRRGTGFTYDRRIQVDLGFLHERNRLFDFIRDAGVTGIVLVSGDSHVGELNAIVIDFMFDGEPRLMYRLFDFVGRSIWEPFVVRADELVNGVTS